MPPRRPRTLLWQLGLAVMLIQSVVAVAFGAYAVVNLRQFHYTQTTQRLEQIAPLAAERFAGELSADAADEINRRARDLAQRLGVRVTVILPDGRVLGDSEEAPAAMDNHRFRPEIDRALLEGAGSAVRFSRTVEADLMYVARTVGGADAPQGVVRVAMPLSDIDAELARLLWLLGLAGAVSLGLTFAAVYLVSRRLSRSVSHLARGALRFAAGDFTHRIHRPGSAELAQATTAFNRMAAQLEQHIERIRAQQFEQRAILQAMRNGVLALDAGHRLLSVNRAAERMLNLDGDAVRGRLLEEALRLPDLHRFVNRAMNRPALTSEELSLDGPAGRIVEATAAPLEDAAGKVAGMVVVLNDVTQLRRLETIRTDFAANVSHELQTPITAIKGYVETLLDSETAAAPEARRFLRIINRNADRLAAIVEDLLALARLEEPQTARALQRADTSVGDLLESVAGQFRAAAAEKAMTLRVEAPAGLTALVNPRLLERAVANLVSNAVKYAPQGTTVTIGGTRADGRLEITVTDEGPGIAARHLPRLFERFYRVDRARSRELGGTGLGLAIVKHIARVHGGRAEVDSKPGRGSTFRVILPDDAS